MAVIQSCAALLMSRQHSHKNDCDAVNSYPLHCVWNFTHHGIYGCDKRPWNAAESDDKSGGDGADPNHHEQVASPPLSDVDGMQQRFGVITMSDLPLISSQWEPTACKSYGDAASAEDLPSPNSHGSADSDSGISGDTCIDEAREQELPVWQGLSQFHLLHELQRGSSGVVHLAMDTRTLHQVAVKLIPHGKVDTNTAREVIAQRQCLMHPHVIQFHGALISRDHSLAIVMEYASGGDLRDFIEMWEGPRPHLSAGLPESLARWFFQQLALAVDYCHDLGIAHRDIKLENALLDRRGPRAILKLCDFGHASCNLARPSEPVLCRHAVGTPEYMAPELFDSATAYDGKVADIWSMGVLLYVMLAGSFPFWCRKSEPATVDGSDNLSRLRRMMPRILGGEYKMPSYFSPSCASLITGMLTVDPSQRMTMSSVLSHPWFQQMLPKNCFAVNQQLLAMPAACRTAHCHQSHDDIMHVVDAARMPL